MADLLIKAIPLPLPRPSGLEVEYPPTIDFKMPLEASRKAAGALFEGGSYPPTGEGVKSLYELLIESSAISMKVVLFWVMAALIYSIYRFWIRRS